MNRNRDGGKGDVPRPIKDRKQFENNWESIFGKNKTIEDFVDEAMKEEYSKITEEINNEPK